jgi:hypothetical protein
MVVSVSAWVSNVYRLTREDSNRVSVQYIDTWKQSKHMKASMKYKVSVQREKKRNRKDFKMETPLISYCASSTGHHYNSQIMTLHRGQYTSETSRVIITDSHDDLCVIWSLHNLPKTRNAITSEVDRLR